VPPSCFPNREVEDDPERWAGPSWASSGWFGGLGSRRPVAIFYFFVSIFVSLFLSLIFYLKFKSVLDGLNHLDSTKNALGYLLGYYNVF
jgi:hypothetical protein